MNINSSQTALLLGGGVSSASKASVYDAITGSQSIYSAISNSFIKSEAISPAQSRQNETLDNLRNYIKENISGKESEKLLASVEAIKTLLNGQDSFSDADPALSLLAKTPFASSNSSLVDLFV